MNGYIKSIGQTQSLNNMQDDQIEYPSKFHIDLDDLLTNDSMTNDQ